MITRLFVVIILGLIILLGWQNMSYNSNKSDEYSDDNNHNLTMSDIFDQNFNFWSLKAMTIAIYTFKQKVLSTSMLCIPISWFLLRLCTLNYIQETSLHRSFYGNHFIITRVQRSWDPRASIVSAFSTFILLNSSKLVTIITYCLVNTNNDNCYSALGVNKENCPLCWSNDQSILERVPSIF